MNRKIITKVLTNKHEDFVKSITDESVRKLVKENSIITGGSIVSLLLNEKGCIIDINPKDACEKNILDGNTLKVETPKGCIYMKANISDIVRPNSIRIAWGWGDYNPDYNLNNLTSDEKRNNITGTPSGRSFMCKVSKVVER